MGYNKVVDKTMDKKHFLSLLPTPRTPEEQGNVNLAAEIRIDKEKTLVARRYDKTAPVKQKTNFLEFFSLKTIWEAVAIKAILGSVS